MGQYLLSTWSLTNPFSFLDFFSYFAFFAVPHVKHFAFFIAATLVSRVTPTLANCSWLVWHAKGGQQKCLIKILSTCDFCYCFSFSYSFFFFFFFDLYFFLDFPRFSAFITFSHFGVPWHCGLYIYKMSQMLEVYPAAAAAAARVAAANCYILAHATVICISIEYFCKMCQMCVEMHF